MKPHQRMTEGADERSAATRRIERPPAQRGRPEKAPEQAKPPEQAKSPGETKPPEGAGRGRRTPEREAEIHAAYQKQRSPEVVAYERNLFKENDVAMRHARGRFEVMTPGRTAASEIQGQVAESVYHVKHGGAIGLVNDLNIELGANSPLYDSCNARELASIKTHISERKGAAEAAYAKDLRQMVGDLKGHKHENLANELWRSKQNGGQRWGRAAAMLPEAVTRADSPEAMKEELIDKSAMRIPDDHVEPARTHVLSNAMRQPEKYGIDPNAPLTERETRAVMLARKIQPLGLSSTDLSLMSRHLYQERYEPTKLANGKRQAVA